MIRLALWTYDFLDRLGIVTHVRYSDGAYANHAATIEKLEFLGLKYVRDTAPKIASNLPYKRYLDAGVRFSMSCSPNGAAIPVDGILNEGCIHLVRQQ